LGGEGELREENRGQGEEIKDREWGERRIERRRKRVILFIFFN
jgi:hypothetical protein